MADLAGEYRYNRLTWEEMNEAIAMQKVVLLPTGSTEQHGPHLPLDTDVFLAESVCVEAAQRAPDRMLVLPPISYGLNLHLAPERVRMDRAVAGHDIMGRYVSSDSTANYPVRFSDIWGRWTSTGVHGDPTQATAEKGQAIFEAAVTNLIAFVDEWRAWPIAERQDQHTQPVQEQIQW